MLSPVEQRIFEELSVFSSWFELDAACEVVSDEPGAVVTEAVLRLVDCSLVVAHQRGDVTQYELLDTMRHYGLERLKSRDDLVDAHERHAAWALSLAGHAAAGLATADEAVWAGRVARHFAEFRAAHEFLVGHEPHAALSLVAALRPYAMWRRNTEVGVWAEVGASVMAGSGDPLLPAVLLAAFAGAWQRGDYAGAAAFAQTAAQAVAPAEPSKVRYVADAAADVAFFAGEPLVAATLHREAAELAIAAGDLLQAMWTLGSVSHALMYGGYHDHAARVADEVRALAERCGAPTAFAMYEWVVGELQATADLGAARAHLERATDLASSVGSRQIVVEAEYGLAIVKARQGDLAGALHLFEELLSDTAETNTAILPRDLVRIIDVLIRADAPQDAATICGAATSGRRTARRFPVAEAALVEATDRLRRRLGDDEMRRRAERGADLDEQGVVAFALDAVRRVTRN
jgi:non-specific serine/threonine protein kinase